MKNVLGHFYVYRTILVGLGLDLVANLNPRALKRCVAVLIAANEDDMAEPGQTFHLT